MMTYISLLRGINVSGKKKIIMKDLKALYVSLGFENVLTYIQSGNVIFQSHEGEEVLIEKIEKAIGEKYGFDVPVQVRSVDEFESIAKASPYNDIDLVEEGSRMIVTFLSKEPSADNVEKLKTYVKEPERLVIKGREIYIHCPNGYGTTKLSNTFIENKLKVRATSRNWKSVVKLYTLGSE